MAGIRGNNGRTWRRLRTPWRLVTEETAVDRRPDAEAGGDISLPARLSSALGRRARFAWRRLTQKPRPPAVPAAIRWLAAHGPGGAAAGEQRLCPGWVAGAAPTLLSYGQTELACAWSLWLLRTQLENGGFPGASLRHASLLNTAQAIQGLSLLADELPAATAAIERACDFLISRIDSQGRIAPLDEASGAFERWAGPSFLLSCLPPLAAAARRCERSDWQAGVDRALEHAKRSLDVTHWTAPLPQHVAMVEALLHLGCRELAAEAMGWPAAMQCRDGSIPVLPTLPWASSEAVARAAVVWYKLNEPERANRAMAWLRKRQLLDGAFPSRSGRGADCRNAEKSAWAAKHFLDAAQLQVQAAFASDGQHLPTEIGLRDGRLAAVCNWLARLDSHVAVADVGCGPGRYVRQLAPRFPQARFSGIDVSRHCLEQLPANVDGRRGGLLRIPAVDGEFDGAMAIESLEHSLLPDQAVRELCRIVRPGGSVLIIDKCISKQPLSEHEPWEQWFSPGEVAGWLAQHCHEVSMTEIAHGPHRQPTGLFLCWQGKRK